MENKQTTCFVISPIGEAKSPVREKADKVLNLIIKPALRKYGFHVIRADQMVSVSPITNDIINQIQNSDLCIIDLTGKNPNVMYEFGRRHETAKPYILLAEKGEKLPFDVSGIRTIFYNLTDPEVVVESMSAIQDIIDIMNNDGFSSDSSGETLASISQKLSRIERKLDSLQVTRPAVGPAIPDDDAVGALAPEQQFAYYLQNNMIPKAEELLPVLEYTTSKEKFYDFYVESLAGEGSSKALDLLLSDIDYIYSLSEKRMAEAIQYICRGFQKTNREDGMDIMGPIIDKCFDLLTDKESKASILNAKARLTNDMDERIKLLNRVVSINPDQPSYYYNLSVCYEAKNDLEEAREQIDRCLELQQENNYDLDHLGQAIDVYAKLGNKAKVDSILTLIKKTNVPFYQLKKDQARRFLRKSTKKEQE